MSENIWQPKPTTQCPTCGSRGFLTSPLGATSCSYCDGTEGGHPPTIGDCADRIEELEAKLAKAVEEAEKYKYAFAAQSRKLQAVLHIDGVRTTLAELTGGKDE